MVLDEAHKAKGLRVNELEERSGTNIGKAVERIQQLLPNARFVYATATFGTTPEDLRYVQRLGLWDEGAGFGGSTAMEFFNERYCLV